MVWKFRDQLQAVLSTAELKQLLQANSQTVPSGESNVRCRGGGGLSSAHLDMFSTDLGLLC